MVRATIGFGDLRFDPATATLERGGTALPIGQRGAALLAALVDAGGATVTKDQLIERAWPGLFVEEANLSVQMSALRKAMGTRPDGTDWVVTVPRVGYRLPREAALVDMPPRPAIVIAPFQTFWHDPQHLHFADGVVEDITTTLSRFKGFAVMMGGASLAAADPASWPERARALGMRYLLAGSVDRRGQQLQLSVRLTDAESGLVLWAEQFRGDLAALFDFQDSIAERVVGLLEPQMQRAEIERARRKRPDSLGAYDLYLRSLPLFRGTSLAVREEAVRLLNQAVQLDPDFASGLAYCAWAHERHDTFGDALGDEERAQTLAMAERAAELGRDDAVVRAISALVLLSLGNEPRRSLAMLEEAREDNPNHSTVLSLNAFAHVMLGDPERGKAGYLRALEIVPEALDSYELLVGVGLAEFMMGQFEAALAWAQRSLAVNSDWIGAHWLAIAALGQLGRRPEAEEVVRRLLERVPTMRLAHLERIGARFDSRYQVMVDGARKGGLPE